MSNPSHSVGDIIYLRESAAAGFLEAYKVSGVTYHAANNEWLYSVTVNTALPVGQSTYGDRISTVNSARLLYTSDELVTYYDALILARNFLTSKLSEIQTKIDNLS